ncbi:beta-1,3-galactosyltransferase 6-like [Homalodisca vitripennis]|uniref:beta-1,3-galactosyltransferase 6-like n=1 Tax=Homalodisca vitripennis TaxID=197043 RepID=UPI001EEC7D47|nr:beta-1,3-galactosyltransferase 6-like [Homalodisca vitripennis]
MAFAKMKLKDCVISFGSFILGCVITVNLLSLSMNEKSKGHHCSEESDVSLKNAKDIKLFSAIDYFLLVIIISGADNVIQRTAIRETWGLLNKDYADVQYFFIIGSHGMSDEKISKLKKEQIKYNDLFLLSVTDNYKTLTIKLLHSFVWFDTEFNFKYILKCDDDSFVLIPKVVNELQNNLAQYEHLYWGYFDGRAHVKQMGKWKETNWFLCDHYLPYALGGGYVLSRSLVHYIRQNQHLLGTYLSEDVSVGTWLSPLNITRFHDVRFDTEYLSRGCNNSFIVTHKQSPKQMKAFYSMFIQTGKLCTKETKTRKSYKYNWNVLPTKCCLPEDLQEPKNKQKELI